MSLPPRLTPTRPVAWVASVRSSTSSPLTNVRMRSPIASIRSSPLVAGRRLQRHDGAEQRRSAVDEHAHPQLTEAAGTAERPADLPDVAVSAVRRAEDDRRADLDLPHRRLEDDVAPVGARSRQRHAAAGGAQAAVGDLEAAQVVACGDRLAGPLEALLRQPRRPPSALAARVEGDRDRCRPRQLEGERLGGRGRLRVGRVGADHRGAVERRRQRRDRVALVAVELPADARRHELAELLRRDLRDEPLRQLRRAAADAERDRPEPLDGSRRRAADRGEARARDRP